MDRALSELCRQSVLSMGRTWPNPAVACVIESAAGLFSGATEVPGGRHAEIAALDAFDLALKEPGASARGSQGRLIVTLEPCSRHGRTPPCTDRILKYPNFSVEFLAYDPLLHAEGERLLREGGMKVAYRPDRLPDAFLRGFLSRSSGSGPRFHLKMAHSGRVAGRRGQRLRISGVQGLALGQMLRSRLDAVVAGPGTVAADRPRLDLRVFQAPLFHRRTGEDLLMDSWLSLGAEIADQSSQQDLSGKRNPYQPLRVFIVKDRFDGSEAWLSEQNAISDRTGREHILLSENPQIWPGALQIPAVRDPGFPDALRKMLAELGCNEVLLECGPGLYSALGPALSVTDRMYFIESKASLTGDVLFAPETFEALPAGKLQRAVYESGTDVLRVIE